MEVEIGSKENIRNHRLWSGYDYIETPLGYRRTIVYVIPEGTILDWGASLFKWCKQSTWI